MMTRVVAAGLLLGSAGIAWLTVTTVIAARLLQATAALSMLYVTYLAWRGGTVMRRRIRASRAAGGRLADGEAAEALALPWITVVVAARNEALVLGDLLDDLVTQQYGDPAGRRFDVIVVDHGSTDGTADVASAVAARSTGLIHILHHDGPNCPRTKAAALAAADPLVRGDAVCVLDADARLGPRFLAGAAAAWRVAPDAAALQVQRRPQNARDDWLAAAQEEELLMDMASQCGRSATGGTAELRGNGMLVRTAILGRLGGWDVGALTEDLELSTRLAAAGERVAQAPEVEVGEEAVTDLGALWRQRMRWAEGSVRRLLDHGPRLLLGSGLPVGRRLDFVVFATEFLIPPLFVTTIAASVTTIPLPAPADWSVPATLFGAYGIGTFLLAMAGLAAHDVRGAALFGRSLRGALFLSHWLLVVPVALVRIAVWPRTRHFAQTPRRERIPDR